jgi:hypothetical protein
VRFLSPTAFTGHAARCVRCCRHSDDPASALASLSRVGVTDVRPSDRTLALAVLRSALATRLTSGAR